MMGEFIKKNKKFVVLGSIGFILVVIMIMGFVAHSEASIYLKIFNEEAEKLLQTPDTLNTKEKLGYVLLKQKLGVATCNPGKSTDKITNPSDVQNQLKVYALELENKIDDIDIEGLNREANNSKNVFGNMTNLFGKVKIVIPFTYLDVEKIGKITEKDPGFFARVGLILGFGKSSELYENLKKLSFTLNKKTSGLKLNEFILVILKDKNILLYEFIRIEGNSEQLKVVKIDAQEIKIFKESEDQKNAVDVGRLALIPALKKQKE